jgi:hypothetical protein
MECNLSREKSGAKERIENNGSGMSVIYTERMLQVVATTISNLHASHINKPSESISNGKNI